MDDKISKRSAVEVLPPVPRLDLPISFATREEETMIRGLQTIPQRRAAAIWFERNGCFKCGSRGLPHAGNALCTKCRKRLYDELETIEKEIKSGEERR
jgi:hypothetical protein